MNYLTNQTLTSHQEMVEIASNKEKLHEAISQTQGFILKQMAKFNILPELEDLRSEESGQYLGDSIWFIIEHLNPTEDVKKEILGYFNSEANTKIAKEVSYSADELEEIVKKKDISIHKSAQIPGDYLMLNHESIVQAFKNSPHSVYIPVYKSALECSIDQLYSLSDEVLYIVCCSAGESEQLQQKLSSSAQLINRVKRYWQKSKRQNINRSQFDIDWFSWGVEDREFLLTLAKSQGFNNYYTKKSYKDFCDGLGKGVQEVVSAMEYFRYCPSVKTLAQLSDQEVSDNLQEIQQWVLNGLFQDDEYGSKSSDKADGSKKAKRLNISSFCNEEGLSLERLSLLITPQLFLTNDLFKQAASDLRYNSNYSDDAVVSSKYAYIFCVLAFTLVKEKQFNFFGSEDIVQAAIKHVSQIRSTSQVNNFLKSFDLVGEVSEFYKHHHDKILQGPEFCDFIFSTDLGEQTKGYIQKMLADGRKNLLHLFEELVKLSKQSSHYSRDSVLDSSTKVAQELLDVLKSQMPKDLVNALLSGSVKKLSDKKIKSFEPYFKDTLYDYKALKLTPGAEDLMSHRASDIIFKSVGFFGSPALEWIESNYPTKDALLALMRYFAHSNEHSIDLPAQIKAMSNIAAVVMKGQADDKLMQEMRGSQLGCEILKSLGLFKNKVSDSIDQLEAMMPEYLVKKAKYDKLPSNESGYYERRDSKSSEQELIESDYSEITKKVEAIKSVLSPQEVEDFINTLIEKKNWQALTVYSSAYSSSDCSNGVIKWLNKQSDEQILKLCGSQSTIFDFLVNPISYSYNSEDKRFREDLTLIDREGGVNLQIARSVVASIEKTVKKTEKDKLEKIEHVLALFKDCSNFSNQYAMEYAYMHVFYSYAYAPQKAKGERYGKCYIEQPFTNDQVIEMFRKSVEKYGYFHDEDVNCSFDQFFKGNFPQATDFIAFLSEVEKHEDLYILYSMAISDSYHVAAAQKDLCPTKYNEGEKVYQDQLVSDFWQERVNLPIYIKSYKYLLSNKDAGDSPGLGKKNMNHRAVERVLGQLQHSTTWSKYDSNQVTQYYSSLDDNKTREIIKCIWDSNPGELIRINALGKQTDLPSYFIDNFENLSEGINRFELVRNFFSPKLSGSRGDCFDNQEWAQSKLDTWAKAICKCLNNENSTLALEYLNYLIDRTHITSQLSYRYHQSDRYSRASERLTYLASSSDEDFKQILSSYIQSYALRELLGIGEREKATVKRKNKI